MPATQMSRRPRFVQHLAVVAAVAAAAPYLVFKVLWLSGSTVGMTSAAVAGQMHGTRYLVGNIVTVAMVFVAVGLVMSLTLTWARRIPGLVIFILGAGAAGLLAPILLGLPLGIVLQSLTGAGTQPADQGLAPWVFGLVYAGFCVLAVAMAISVGAHVVDRWGHLLAAPPSAPSAFAVVCGAVGMLPFAGAMAYWGVMGPGSSGPQGMDLPAQRTVLVVTAVLGVASFVIPLVSRHLALWPRTAWLVTWTGCCVVILQGPAQIVLAQDAVVQPLVVVLALAAVPGGIIYGLAVMRSYLQSPPNPDAAALARLSRKPLLPDQVSPV